MTIVELLIAVSLTIMLSAIVFTFFLTFAKATLTMADYSEFDMNTGKLLQNFSRDVREAEAITWVNGNSFKLLKKGIDYTYNYNPDQEEVTRQETGQRSIILASNVSELDFIAYDVSGSPLSPGISYSTLSDNTKMMQVTGEFRKDPTARATTTSKFVSARYILRNKDTPTP